MEAVNAAIKLQDVLANALRATINLRRQRVSPPDYVLLELKGELPERESARTGLQRQLPFLRKGLTVEALNDRLNAIAGDPDVRGILLQLGPLEAGVATLQNVRSAIERFKKRGKRVVVYATTLDLPRYFIGSAADDLIIPESGSFNVKGLASQVTFVKDMLARVGVKGDFEAIGEYKNAADALRRSEMSEAHREVINAILDSYFEDIVEAVANGRDLPQNTVRDIIDQAPLQAHETNEAGLTDAIRYEDQLVDYLSGDDKSLKILSWEQAQTSLKQSYLWHGVSGVGVISLRGAIFQGESRDSPVPVPVTGSRAGSESIARAFRKAEKDPTIAAIIFHVDSPGGDALASDLIWREVKRVKDKKPVVAFMGDVAGSGGYYVATPADLIVAQSGTLTGSIGVVGGKIVTGELYDKIKANREVISRGRHADMDLPDEPYSDEEREKVSSLMNSTYDLFKKRVADGRDMTIEEVENIARGRVWTGRQALEIGLVDELGDFQTALDRAKLLAGLPLDNTVPIIPVEGGKRHIMPPTFDNGQALIKNLVETLQPLSGTQIMTLMPWTLEIKY